MPRYIKTKTLARPWQARASHKNVRVYLGNYPTYEEALAVEKEYREKVQK